MPRRRIFRLLRPAARSAFGVQNLRRRALHAAIRAEHAAVAGLGAQHLVAARALMSQECHHGGHHHFPLRSAYWAGQDRNLDGSASHAAVDPWQENVSGPPLNPLWQRGVNHAVHHRNIVAAVPAFAAVLPTGFSGLGSPTLIPESSIPLRETRAKAPGPAGRFGLRNAQPAGADHASGCLLTASMFAFPPQPPQFVFFSAPSPYLAKASKSMIVYVCFVSLEQILTV